MPHSNHPLKTKWNPNNWSRGTRFSIAPKTRFERLPTGHRGQFEIINDAHFDGEKFYTGEYSPAVHCIKYDSEYTIEEKIHSFSKAELDRYLEEGYAHIKKSSEENF